MYMTMKHIRFRLCAAMLLAGLTGCGPAPMPAREAAPQDSSPSPLPPTDTPVHFTATPRPFLAIDSIQMMDRSTGWATGEVDRSGARHILRTMDGGTSWRDVSPTAQSFYDYFFLDTQAAWIRASDNHEMWRTTDGGENWTSLGKIEGSEFWFNDAEHGWKLDAEAWGLSFVQFDILSFATTQDGGQTWQEVEVPPGHGLTFMAYPDPQSAWAIRAGFAKNMEGFPNLVVPFSLLTTMDGGRSWNLREMPLPSGVDVVRMAPAETYLDVGNCTFDSPAYSSTEIWKLALLCEKGGWLYTSTDQGQTWTIEPLPDGYVTEVQFLDPVRGWALRKDGFDSLESKLYQTTDGGQTWALLTSTGWANASLDFVDEQFGWAAVITCETADCNPYGLPRALMKTTDGGRTWQTIP